MSAPRTHVPDLTPGRTWPELDTFTVLARDRRIVPVVRRLVADGETLVSGVHHVDRGYPRFEEAMQALGADVTREPDDTWFE